MEYVAQGHWGSQLHDVAKACCAESWMLTLTLTRSMRHNHMDSDVTCSWTYQGGLACGDPGPL